MIREFASWGQTKSRLQAAARQSDDTCPDRQIVPHVQVVTIAFIAVFAVQVPPLRERKEDILDWRKN